MWSTIIASMNMNGKSKRDLFLSFTGLAVLAIILALGFSAYLNPVMLIEFANLRFCY
jgi:hypothetical protein